MKNASKLARYLLIGAFVFIALSAAAGTALAANFQIGEAEFKEFCSACHMDG